MVPLPSRHARVELNSKHPAVAAKGARGVSKVVPVATKVKEGQLPPKTREGEVNQGQLGVQLAQGRAELPLV